MNCWRRLKEGKVYIPDQAARAIQEFFRKGNLTALREMALRRAAERVDGQMRSYMRTRAIPAVWPATERLLVCISPSPYAEKVVRTGRRLADELNAEWFTVYVEVVTKPENKPTNRARIDQALRLAESLGAKARTITGHSIREAVFAYARKHNITKIVIGKPLRPRWQEWLSGIGRGSIDLRWRRHRYLCHQRENGIKPAGGARRHGGRTDR